MNIDKLFKKAFKNFGGNFQSNSISNICSTGSISQINTSFGSSTTINGKTYKGKNIQVNNGKVIIDGVVQKADGKDEILTGDITIVVNGNCDSVESDSGDIVINGDAKAVSSSNGDITISKDVKGNVSTSNGDVDVKGQIAGNVTTSNGDITSRK